MEFYKRIKSFVSKTPKLAAIGILAALPYICESCEYSGKKAHAAEVRQETTIQESPLEIILEK